MLHSLKLCGDGSSGSGYAVFLVGLSSIEPRHSVERRDPGEPDRIVTDMLLDEVHRELGDDGRIFSRGSSY